MIRFLTLSILLMFSVLGLNAQELVFTTRVQGNENKMGTQDIIRVQYEIQNTRQTQGFHLLGSKDFKILGEPSEGSTFSNLNGKVSMSKIFTFTFQPKRTGRLNFPIAIAQVRRKNIRSNKVSIDVIKGRVLSQEPQRQRVVDPFANDPFSKQMEELRKRALQQQRQLIAEQQRRRNNVPQQDPLRQRRPARMEINPGNLDDNLFIRAIVDKTEARVGEQITVIYKLFTRVPATFRLTKLPKLSNFLREDFDLPRFIEPKREIINGKEFEVYILGKSAIFPIKTGELTIDPVEGDGVATLQKAIRVRRNSPYGNIFRDEINYEPYEQKVPRASLPISITVKEFPEEDKPTSFKGAVGSFEIESKISAVEMTTDDVATLTVTIRGSGNIKLLDAPKLLLPDSILEIFEPIEFDTITSKAKNKITGYKKIKYRFSPKGTGELKVPAITLAYYNADAERYEITKTPEYTIRVKPGKVQRQGQQILPMYIHDIASENMKLQKDQSTVLPEQMWYWGAYLLPTLGFIFLLGFSRKDEKDQKDQVRFKNKRANKVALKRLDKAERHRKANEHTKFYEEASKAVWLYLSDKLNIPLATLSKEMAGTLLRRKEISQDLIDEVFLITDECELALYAPAAGDFKMNQIYSDSLRLIGTLEDKLA